jgi:hypothetical protein
MINRMIIKALLKLFPAKWRSEYGVELSFLVEREPLKPSIVWDLLRSGFVERVRMRPIWVTPALLLALWSLVGMGANTIRAMSPEIYNLFWRGFLLWEVGLGFWFRRRGSVMPGRATAYAVLLGWIPLLGIELLRTLHFVNPTVLDLQGHVSLHGHGFTEFVYRGIPNPHLEFFAFLFVLLLFAIIASFAGWLGGRFADGIKVFQTATSSQ